MFFFNLNSSEKGRCINIMKYKLSYHFKNLKWSFISKTSFVNHLKPINWHAHKQGEMISCSWQYVHQLEIVLIFLRYSLRTDWVYYKTLAEEQIYLLITIQLQVYSRGRLLFRLQTMFTDRPVVQPRVLHLSHPNTEHVYSNLPLHVFLTLPSCPTND